MNLRDNIAEKAREVLQALADGKIETWMKAQAAEVLPALTPRVRVEKAPIASVEHHDQERAADNRRTVADERKVYREVAARDLVCQVDDLETFGPHAGELEIDHQWGRGKEPTTARNCRRICERHHRMKTDGSPSALAWILNFMAWAFRMRFWDEYGKARVRAELERAQHPEASDA